MADCLSQRKTKPLQISTHHEVLSVIVKKLDRWFEKKHSVFDCEQFSCYVSVNWPLFITISYPTYWKHMTPGYYYGIRGLKNKINNYVTCHCQWSHCDAMQQLNNGLTPFAYHMFIPGTLSKWQRKRFMGAAIFNLDELWVKWPYRFEPITMDVLTSNQWNCLL